MPIAGTCTFACAHNILYTCMVKIMKKAHWFLLIVTAVLALFSAYSLAAMNQVYKINFEWFSQYNGRYISVSRDTSQDHWSYHGYPENMHFDFICSRNDLKLLKEGAEIPGQALAKTDFTHSFLIHCAFGKVDFPEYRIKIIDIAQKGNVVEVRVSLNSPSKQSARTSLSNNTIKYYPQDTVKIDFSAFPAKGDLVFIFKNQDGSQIAERKFSIKGDVIDNSLSNLSA